MKTFTHFLFLLLFFIFILWLQSNEFLNIKNITPNLILISFLIASFVVPFKDIKFIFIILLGVSIVSFFWFSFWTSTIFLAGLLGILFSLVKKIISGDIFIDFLLTSMVATFLFYLLTSFLGFGIIIWPIIIWEIIYNIIIGEIILFGISKI